jgi:integrase
MSSRPARQRIDTGQPEHTDRDWFLSDSTWDDAVWILAPTNLLEEEELLRIRWNFLMQTGRHFTDPCYASLLQTAKQLLSIIRARSLYTGLPHRARTAFGYFIHLRTLLHWMDQEGFRRFADLDRASLLSYQRVVRQRKARSGAPINSNTVRDHLQVLVYLYRCRAELDDGLSFDPFAGESAGARARASYGRYTPDDIAVPLIQKSIEFLEGGAIDVLRAREAYALAMARSLHWRRQSASAIGNSNCAAVEAMQGTPIHTPHGEHVIRSVPELSDLIDMLYTACFVVITYLVGARAHEVLHLRSGCIRARPSRADENEAAIAVMVGTLFKHEPEYHGRVHEWVVPQAAIHAVSVLEALSAPHRMRSGRTELWLRGRSRSRTMGATEWIQERDESFPIRIPTPATLGGYLERYAEWLQLPTIEGRRWQLTTHQGRKTFARFAALRDRSCLFALAQQLGHRDRGMTDSGYAGTDYRLEREIDKQVLEQSVLAWEHMLAAPQLGGRAGSEIIENRPRFRGTRSKEDIRLYARMLVEAGLTLAVCDYGYCVYREEYSACRGNALGPNPIHREPSTCARCINFAVAAHHRPYWLEQARRCERLLSEPQLPTQTLKIARERLGEARAMLHSIDKSTKETHGQDSQV